MKTLPRLRETWTNPEKFKPTPTQQIVIDRLGQFLEGEVRYGSLVVYGEHGIGKTFAVRKFLADVGLIKSYVNFNLHVAENLKKVSATIERVDMIADIAMDFLTSVSKLAFIDSSEILQLLPTNLLNPLFTKIKYRPVSDGKIVLVYSSSNLPMATPSIFMSNPTKEDIKVFLSNLRIIFNESYLSEKTFTGLIRRI